MTERTVRRTGASLLVLGLFLSLFGLALPAAPAGALTDTTGLVCNNQKARADQDCEGANKHGTIAATLDPVTGDLTFDIAATGSFVGTGWRQIYICIPGTQKSQSADCQGNTASVLDPRPKPGGAYDVSVPATNTENAKDVAFACSDTIKATVDADDLPDGNFGWTVHVNTCGGGTDEAFGSVTRPNQEDSFAYSCLAPLDVTQTTATLRGSTDDSDVDRAAFTFTAPASETRTFTDTDAASGFAAAVTGLSPNTAYTYTVDFFEGDSVRANGQAKGCTFTTNPTPDTYACAAPEEVTAESATLLGSTSNGQVDTGAFTLTPATGTATTVAGAERGDTNVWAGAAKGLLPDTRYTYTVAFKDGDDAVGTGSGEVCAFTTKAAAVLSTGTQQPAPDPAPAAAPVMAVAAAAAVAPAELPRTGVATGLLLPFGIALVLLGLAALVLGGRQEPVIVLGRPRGRHYLSSPAHLPSRPATKNPVHHLATLERIRPT